MNLLRSNLNEVMITRIDKSSAIKSFTLRLLYAFVIILISFSAYSQTTTVDNIHINSPIWSNNGNGLKFNGYNHAKIDWGTGSNYTYGPVTSYSIKSNASSEVGRGWSWGVVDATPIAALSNTGNMKIAGTMEANRFQSYGPIIASARSTNVRGTLDGQEAIIVPGGTSNYLISAQDGNGRIQHKWNATYGTGEKFVVANEDASFIDWNSTASSNSVSWIDFKFADGAGKQAGESINWQTHFSITQGGDVLIPNGDLIVKGENIFGLYNPQRSGTIFPVLEYNPTRKEVLSRSDLKLSNKLIVGEIIPTNGTLEIDGIVRCREELTIHSATEAFPDYVFEESYYLRDLETVEQFIKANKHLPEIPSAKEVGENGLGIYQINTLLLKKVEELTLYTIAQDKQLKDQSEKYDAQEKRIAQLEALIKKLAE